MKNNVLICFLSCKKNNNLWEKLLNINNSIIFFGDPEINEPFIFKDNILTLKCNDTYDYLPVKIYLMIKAILKIRKFNNITHILKIDDWDTKVDNNTHNKLKYTNLTHYCGQNIINKYLGERKYHFNKCPLNSIWNNKMYNGNFVPWADGGCGYILSRVAMNIISIQRLTINKIYNNMIYEDVMIALLLYKSKIFPKKIPKIIIADK